MSGLRANTDLAYAWLFKDRIAEVEVVGDGRAVSAGCVHGFHSNLGRGCGERGKDAACMEPARAVGGAKDSFPVEVAGFNLGYGCMAAVGASGSRTHTVAALGEIEPVADRAADEVGR